MGAETGASIEVTPDRLSGSVKSEVKGETKGEHGSASASVTAEITATSEVVEEDGRRRWTTTAKASVSGEASGDAKGKVRGHDVKGSGSISAEASVEVKYEVSVPVGAKPERTPSEISPYTPESMPPGTIITLDSSENTEWEAEGSVSGGKGIWGGTVGASYGESDSKGVTVSIEKTSETKVKVSVGPTEAKGRHGKVEVGLEVGPLEVGLGIGSSTSAKQATVREVEFDLATPEGKAAYDHFMATGELPTQAGPGVSGTTVVARRNGVTAMDLEASLGVGGETVEGSLHSEATYDTVTTTHPDGSKEVEYREKLPGYDGALTVKRTYGPDGKEDVSKRVYQYEVEVTDANAAGVNGMLNLGYGDGRKVKKGDWVTVELSQEDYDRLCDQAVEASGKKRLWGNEGLVPGQAGSVDRESFLSSLLERGAKAFNLLQQLALDTGKPLPGKVKVNGE
ncbi:hypothetical protein POL68_17615 [Stigmatella sp. ncwal1]|uniref:Uncharacterized protein n=1 Tax=Stigmatella ashevillensis TaxID=2995309 RepID=A0ABT5DBW6_9BACT|nr:hypothetical protein [Stigmatella ashevillena]MDC0710298.1 hypothetical protein [Stigmatella ashevillena]